MSIQVKINTVDLTSQVVKQSLEVQQILTSQVDTARLQIKKYGSRTYVPAIADEVEVYDGTTKIFGGYVQNIDEASHNNAAGIIFDLACVDYGSKMMDILVSKTYTSQTIEQIIDDLFTTYLPTYTTTNVTGSFTVGKIVFNQISLDQAIKRLANIVQYEYYVDELKDLHFFPKFTESAPFTLTDTNGNCLPASLKIKTDGTQIVNQVKVRGGEYEGATYTDSITVKGNDSKTFKMPYKFANLTIKVNTVSKTVGIDFIDDPATKDVLYNYQDQTIKFPTAKADGDVIEFSGNPKIPVLSIASDATSIALYGLKEKIIRDTSIIDLTVARRRAAAEIQTYKNKIDEITFDTYNSGLRTGQTINVSSTILGITSSFLIKRLTFKPLTHDTFYYQAEGVTARKFYLIELLQKIFEPEADNANESEVSEIIKTDIVDLSIAESVTRLTAHDDDATVTIAEVIGKDPLGAGVEPDWVLAPYFPASISDTKREGRLDYSLKVY